MAAGWRRLTARLRAGARRVVWEVRAWVGKGSGPRRGTRPTALVLAKDGDRPVFARAKPESVRLTETYFYERVIARHDNIKPKAPPTGVIKVVVPYDGERYFGRQAYEDVQRQLGSTAPPGVEALIGHLALRDIDGTDLASVLDLSGSHGSVPLRVPVSVDDIAYPDWLRADRHACVVEYKYRPDDPRVIPVEIAMELFDAEGRIPGGEAFRDQLAQSGSFHPDMLLQVDVILWLPNELERPKTPPRVRRVTMDWPTVTSLQGLNVTAGTTSCPLDYDPEESRLGWSDVPMEPDEEESAGTESRVYRCTMVLAIHRPGELYQESSIDGRIEMEVPGLLLSGLRARLYDGTGHQPDDLRPQLSTRLVADFRLILDEAFPERKLRPYQLLCFDQVTPDAMRLADIRATLYDHGFRIEPPPEDELPSTGTEEFIHLLVASRPRGPDLMRLWLLVEGKRYLTQRQARVQGGLTYTSPFETGELRIHMGGILPGDGEAATHEMNELQTALRDRFERLRDRR